MLKAFSNLSPPAKWLIAFIVIVLGLSFLFAPRPQPVDVSEISFTTTSSSVLYFKNIRSYYYNIYEREKAPFTLYRYKRRELDTTKPYLQFMIVRNAAAGEAYVYAEASPALKQYDSLAVFISDHPGGEGKITYLSTMINEDHYLFSADVFSKILNGGKVYLLNKNDTLTELFAGKRERKNAGKVLEDYFKLVNKN